MYRVQETNVKKDPKREAKSSEIMKYKDNDKLSDLYASTKRIYR
jgi:hypothetical protein